MYSVGSAPDPNTLTDLDRQLANWDPRGKTVVSGDKASGQNTLTLIVFGQSKADNTVLSDSYTIVNPLVNHNLSIFDGGCYLSEGGLLGNSVKPGLSYSGTSYLIRLADQIITAGTYQRVVIVPLCLGSCSLKVFDTGDNYAGVFTNLSERFAVAKSRLASHGLIANYILLDQGETDAINGTSAASYTTTVRNISATCTAVGLTAPLYVAQTSYHPQASPAKQANIRLGQFNAVNGTTILLGPDLDTISHVPGDGKRDALSVYVHFSGTSLSDGASDAAALWKTSLGL